MNVLKVLRITLVRFFHIHTHRFSTLTFLSLPNTSLSHLFLLSSPLLSFLQTLNCKCFSRACCGISRLRLLGQKSKIAVPVLSPVIRTYGFTLPTNTKHSDNHNTFSPSTFPHLLDKSVLSHTFSSSPDFAGYLHCSTNNSHSCCLIRLYTAIYLCRTDPTGVLENSAVQPISTAAILPSRRRYDNHRSQPLTLRLPTSFLRGLHLGHFSSAPRLSSHNIETRNLRTRKSHNNRRSLCKLFARSSRGWTVAVTSFLLSFVVINFTLIRTVSPGPV